MSRVEQKIGVVGSGIAGLAASYFLARDGEVTVITDGGGGASAASTGLMHPFPGKRGLRSWRGEEGMARSVALFELAQRAIGKPVFAPSGLLRLATGGHAQEEAFREAAAGGGAVWRSREEVAASVPGILPVPGIWIPGACTVFMERYLAGLRLLCVERGVVFREQTVAGWEELEAFDGVVWAAGAGIRPLLRGIDRFGLRPTGGRALVCRAGRYPPCPIGGEALIAPTSEEGIYTIGSTYERGEWNPVALQELREKAGRIYPPSLEWEELEVRQGVRLGREPLYRPIAEQVSDREWLLGGFGSRGLLYHALLAEELAEKVRSAILGAL